MIDNPFPPGDPHYEAWGRVGQAERPAPPELRVINGYNHDEDEDDPRRDRMRARLYSRSRLDDIPPPIPLIDGVLDVATIAFLSGRFASYKTFVSVAWACSIATGNDWFGRKVTTPGTVVYIAGEGCNGLLGRIRAWEEAHNGGRQVPDERLHIYDGRVNLGDDSPGGDVGFLTGVIRELRPVLVVVDTLHKCAPGMDENSSKDMSIILDVAARLREAFGVTILFNHHTGHAGTHSRGSSSIEDDADTVWLTTRGDETGPEVQRTLVHRKVKNGATLPDIPIILSQAAGDVYVTEGMVDALPGGLAAETVIGWLDDLNVPVLAGRDLCRQKLATEGRKVDTNILAEAIRRRKKAAFETPRGSDERR